jgi:cbb3-type cytochrome oxidase maturation protein
MNIIVFLAPFSLLLAGLGLAGFFWTFRSSQYDDPQGDAARILYDHRAEGPDDLPAPPPETPLDRP